MKPVIVIKAGRHQEGSRAALSHTGSLVGGDDAFDGLDQAVHRGAIQDAAAEGHGQVSRAFELFQDARLAVGDFRQERAHRGRAAVDHHDPAQGRS